MQRNADYILSWTGVEEGWTLPGGLSSHEEQRLREELEAAEQANSSLQGELER